MELSIGMAPYLFAGMSLYEAMDHIANLGFEYVDIHNYYGWQMSNQPVKNQLRLANKMEKLGIRACSAITTPDYQAGTLNKDEQEHVLGQLIRTGNFIKRMGGDQVTIGRVAGILQMDRTPEDVTKKAFELMNRYGEWCETNGVKLVIELAPGIRILPPSTAEEMRWAISQITTTKAYCNVDVAHFVLSAQGYESLNILKDDIIHMHFSDTDGKDAGRDLILGEGVVNFKAWVDKCFELGIEENCKKANTLCAATIEVARDAIYPYPDDLVMKSYNYILKTVPYFRGADNQ